jgi:hypothetical protein
MYIDVVRHLRVVVSRKCHEKWRTNSWFLLHDNTPAHQSVLVKYFLETNNLTKLELPQYLAPTDLYLFPELKSPLKGQHFCYATDILQNVMEELKRLSQIGFQECFQHLYCHQQKFIVAQGDCFEGNID